MDDLEEIIDALAHLICTDDDKKEYIPVTHRIDAAQYDGFDVLTIADQNDYILIGDHANDQPIWPMDVCFALRMRPELGWPPGSWQFNRLTTLNMKDWRGVIHKFYPRMLDFRFTVAAPDGKKVSARVPYAIVNNQLLDVKRETSGQRINSIFAGGIPPSYFGERSAQDQLGEDEKHVALMAAGMSLRRHYNWSVLLGEGKGPRARFITDVQGIKEVFRLRDLPAGRQRRAALLHWVREHWRKRRDRTANDRVLVQKHLSGTWSFVWNDLRCQIEPSADDVDWLIGNIK